MADAPPPSSSSSSEARAKTPVLVLSGFLGSGKTTLLRHILKSCQSSGQRFAMIVNDMAEVNIDSALVQQHGSKLRQVEEKVVDLHNGCICCTLREDLIKEVRALADHTTFDYIIIECTGVAEPMPVAESFFIKVPELAPLSDICEIDAMLTVVDTSNFLEYFNSTKSTTEVHKETPEDDERMISHLFIDQVEFANILVMNKLDKVSAEHVTNVEAVLRKLNPSAKLLRSTYSEVPITELLNTKLFEFEKMSLAPGWCVDLRNSNHTPETDEYGIGSFVYRRRQPFHPRRLYELMHSAAFLSFPILRAKGFVWMPQLETHYAEWCQVGKVANIEVGARWYCTMEEGKWELKSSAAHEDIKQHFSENSLIGDRRQEIVFIGQSLDKAAVEAALDTCLISVESAFTEDEWEDPFELDDDEEGEEEEEEEEEEDDGGK